jgi:hypothetical protein
VVTLASSGRGDQIKGNEARAGLTCRPMSRQVHRAFLLPSRTFILPRFERVARHIVGRAEMSSGHEATVSAETESRDLQQSSTGSILRAWVLI